MTDISTDTPTRKPRLLWANPFCLLDTSSGASLAVREMLIQLIGQGYEVAVVGATIFDAETGITRLEEHWQTIQASDKKVISVTDTPLTHQLINTHSTQRNRMTADEENHWYTLYVQTLEAFQPDLVWFYGGQTLDMLIADEARLRGIPSAAFLVNGNYQSKRWCRDVDLILTDTKATADHYRETQGFPVKAVGAFIDPAQVTAATHSRERVLFINPSLTKGAAVVVQLALLLEKRRPDILFEVVESRGNWQALVKQLSAHSGEPRETLGNVIVTPNTRDMRPVYGRARVLLAPSLWWESGARVLAEAMLNGIPAIVTNHGGSPEMIQDGGLTLTLPEACHQSPYTEVPHAENLAPLVERLIRWFDDEADYQAYVARAYRVGQTHHALETSTARLVEAFAPLVAKRAGDHAAKPRWLQCHKQLREAPS